MTNWSPYQKAIFEANKEPGNLFVNAVAGSGKTTTMVACIEDVPIEQTVLAVAFGRDIKKTLETKLGHLPNVAIMTLNGFGYAACRTAVGRYIKIKESKVRDVMFYDILDKKKELFWKSHRLIIKIISIFKSSMIWQPTLADMLAVMSRFNLDLPKGTKTDQIFDLLEVTYNRCMNKTTVMDFDDQIAMPLYYGWTVPTYDRIFVDEAQDLTPAQIELTKLALKDTERHSFGGIISEEGKAIYVGDSRQAIYQFRGADSKAVENIISSMNCKELPLSICYRCSKAVVRAAQKIVPYIEYHEEACEGTVEVISLDDFKVMAHDGDLVLCRCTAPLVKACLDFIKNGKKATIKGREIGQGIIDFINNVSDGVDHLKDFNDKLCAYVAAQEEKLKFREDALILLNDTYETVICLYERADSVSGILRLICEIFADDVEGVMLMTIHKAKGLESPNVFILAPELMPHKLAATEEALLAEENLIYVAITRAKENLFLVGGNLRILESSSA
jgi:superfamily I DNA/RNA helicase